MLLKISDQVSYAIQEMKYMRTVANTLLTALTMLSFQVDITDSITTPKPGPGDPSPWKDVKYTASVAYSNTEALFNVSVWDPSKPSKPEVELGRGLLLQKQLNLLQGLKEIPKGVGREVKAEG